MKTNSLKSKISSVIAILVVTFICQYISQLVQRLELAENNTNMIFGLFGNNTISIFITILLLIILIIFYFKSETNRSPLIFVLSGAISNLIDRLHFGGVIDYINLPLIPTFNLADILILFGLIFFFLSQLKTPSHD